MDELSRQDSVGREMAIAKGLREKVDLASSSDKNLEFKTGGGKTMSIPNPKAQGTSKALFADKPIPAKEYRQMMTATNMSNNKGREVAQAMRSFEG